MGAFKFRGAYNALSRLSPETKKAGVVSYSSGNHGQAIAYAGQLLGIKTTIVMPEDAPQLKVAAAKGYGGNIVFFDRYTEDWEVISQKIIDENPGSVLVTPFNHKNVLAGAGTAVKELFEEVGDLDHLFVSVGGGGLIAGSAISKDQLCPSCILHGVEPDTGNDGKLSLAKGEIVTIPAPDTLADGAATRCIGQLPFAIMQKSVDDILTVSDQDLIDSMKFFAQTMKMVVEPTGCLSFAGLKTCGLDLKGKRVGVLISGGNLDLIKYAKLISS